MSNEQNHIKEKRFNIPDNAIKLPIHHCFCGRRYWGHEVGCMACRVRRGLVKRYEWNGMVVYLDK